MTNLPEFQMGEVASYEQDRLIAFYFKYLVKNDCNNSRGKEINQASQIIGNVVHRS